MVLAFVHDGLEASADTEKEAIGVILSMTSGNLDIALFHTVEDKEANKPYKIAEIRD